MWQTPCTHILLYHGRNITVPCLPNGVSHGSDVEYPMDLTSSSSSPRKSANDVVSVSPLVYGRDTVSNQSGENESERNLPLMKLRLDDWSTGWLIARGYSMVLTDRSRFVESRLVDKCSQEERKNGRHPSGRYGTGWGWRGGGVDAETVSFGRTWMSRLAQSGLLTVVCRLAVFCCCCWQWCSFAYGCAFNCCSLRFWGRWVKADERQAQSIMPKIERYTDTLKQAQSQKV